MLGGPNITLRFSDLLGLNMQLCSWLKIYWVQVCMCRVQSAMEKVHWMKKQVQGFYSPGRSHRVHFIVTSEEWMTSTREARWRLRAHGFYWGWSCRHFQLGTCQNSRLQLEFGIDRAVCKQLRRHKPFLSGVGKDPSQNPSSQMPF